MTLRMGTSFSNPYKAIHEKDSLVPCPFSFSENVSNGKICTHRPYTKIGALKTHLITQHAIEKGQVNLLVQKARVKSLENQPVIEELTTQSKVKGDDLMELFKERLLSATKKALPEDILFIIDFETTGGGSEREGMLKLMLK